MVVTTLLSIQYKAGLLIVCRNLCEASRADVPTPPLSQHIGKQDAGTLRPLFEETSRLDAWLPRWRARLAPDAAARMRAVNPIYVPRNLKVEEALAAAEAGDMAPFEALLAVISDPFTERPGLDAYALPAPQEFVGQFRTFCGT